MTILQPTQSADGLWRAIISDPESHRVATAVRSRTEGGAIAKAKNEIDRAYGFAADNPMPKWFAGEPFGSILIVVAGAAGLVALGRWIFGSNTPQAPAPAPLPSGGGGGYAGGFVPGNCDPSARAGCPPEGPPPGFVVWNGKSNAPYVRAFAQNYLLAEPLGAWVDFIINETEYKGHLECHFHPCGGDVKPWGVHKGATIYEKTKAVA